PIRQFKPVTKGTRFRSVSDFADITTTTPEKSLLEPIKKSGGRDNHGHIAMRRRDGDVDRVRSEPFGAYRARDVRGRREAIHHPSEGTQRQRHDHVGTRL